MEYKSVKEIALLWNISDRRVRQLCVDGKVPGAYRNGRAWQIPSEAEKPEDGRSERYSYESSSFAAELEEIENLKREIASRRPLTQGELQRLRDEFLVDYTYNSNAIEGNTLTLKETALVLEGITISKKPLKDHLEAVGHKEAFCYVESLVADKTEFSERVIKMIHSLVLMDRPEDRGTFRRIPVIIQGAIHTPVEPYLIEPYIEQLLHDYASMKQHPIEKAALFHLRFEGIHPFIDGNGRTGRLILNLMLMQYGLPPVNVKYSDRMRYYEAFDAFYGEGNPDAMTAIIIEEELDNLRKLLSILDM